MLKFTNVRDFPLEFEYLNANPMLKLVDIYDFTME